MATDDFGPTPIETPTEILDMAGPAPVSPRGWRISNRAKVASVAIAATATMIAGVAVWSPWRPAPPTGLHATSRTATSALISWRASAGSLVGPGSYLVLRGGKQVGSVPAGATSWTDHGLTPGVTYHYAVVAAGLGHSAPSATATVTAMTPSPVRLTADATHTTVALHWSPPPLAPAPDAYLLYNGTSLVDTLAGTTTAYTDKSQAPGAAFSYTVIAQWGNNLSRPSAAASGETVAAPLSSAVPVHVDTTGSPGPSWGPIVVGYDWDDAWSATPSCTPNDCTMSVTVGIGPSDKSDSTVPVPLRHSGSGYSGTATAKLTGCKTPQSVVMETDTVTLTMRPAKGAVHNGAWTAWTGTMVLSAPYLSLDNGYCPAGTWTFAVTSALSPGRPRFGSGKLRDFQRHFIANNDSS